VIAKLKERIMLLETENAALRQKQQIYDNKENVDVISIFETLKNTQLELGTIRTKYTKLKLSVDKHKKKEKRPLRELNR